MKLLHLFFCMATWIGYIRATHENIAEYLLMCKIFRVATTQPTSLKLHGNRDPAIVAAEIIKTMEFLNYSTTERSLYDLIRSTNDLGAAKEDNPATKDLSTDEWSNLKARFADLKAGGESSWEIKFARPKREERVKVLHARVGRLLHQAKDLYGKVGMEGGDIQNALKEAQVSLLQAAFGESRLTDAKTKSSEDLAKLQAEQGSFFTWSATSNKCKADNQGNAAGKSIVSDIACLCGLPSNPGVADACGTGNGVGAQRYTEDRHGLTVWNGLKTHCKTPTDPDPKLTPENLHHLVGEFRSLLGKNGYDAAPPTNAGQSVGRHNVLGVYHAGAATFDPCDGTAPTTTGAHGFCVDYHPAIKAGKQIPWVKNILAAAQHLEEAREKFLHQKDILSKLEAIEGKALDLYYEAMSDSGAITEGLQPLTGSQEAIKSHSAKEILTNNISKSEIVNGVQKVGELLKVTIIAFSY